ncbi:uncharacterized protein [Anabrus simplex]|uniref:uncharacterized protein n=1 Tax=Anabrus simplex TaxID=316456 RepID=UPI0035A387B5
MVPLHTKGDWVQVSVMAPNATSLTTKPFSLNDSHEDQTLQMQSMNVSVPEIQNLQFMTSPEKKSHLSDLSFVSVDKAHDLTLLTLEGINRSTTRSYFSELPVSMLKTVHNTLLQKTPHTVKGKMKYLQQLKERLYNYIEIYIKRIWTPENRQSRTDKGMGFPSMEGALMTICFLLFAVFLVKLVQQLIQCLQNGTGTTATTTTMLMTGIPATTTGRRRRSLSEILATARILQLMDEFQIHHDLHSS